MPITPEEAKENLKEKKKEIQSTNPADGKKGVFRKIRKLCPSKNANEIKYFNRINEKVKNKFRQHQDKDIEIVTLPRKHAGPTGSGPGIGIKWNTMLRKCINGTDLSDDEKIAKSVIEELKKCLKGIEFWESDFPLFGYMTHKTESDVSFWNGRANAIGWYKGRYVIVEWKVVDVLEFWRKNPCAYGDYLHQCLVYARLLKLHLHLPELPYILLVAINRKSGNQIHPGMFYDFPEECKNELEEYEWSKKVEKTPKILELPKNLVNSDYEDHEDEIQETTKLHDLFAQGCKVGDLLHVLGLNELRVALK